MCTAFYIHTYCTCNVHTSCYCVGYWWVHVCPIPQDFLKAFHPVDYTLEEASSRLRQALDKVCVGVWVCHTYMCVWVCHTCMCVWVCHTCMRVCVCVCVCVCVYMHAFVNSYIYVCVCVCACTQCSVWCMYVN